MYLHTKVDFSIFAAIITLVSDDKKKTIYIILTFVMKIVRDSASSGFLACFEPREVQKELFTGTNFIKRENADNYSRKVHDQNIVATAADF